MATLLQVGILLLFGCNSIANGHFVEERLQQLTDDFVRICFKISLLYKNCLTQNFTFFLHCIKD
jgi:hypothetical protein